MSVPVTQVDAFAEVPFGGNPAAVCFLDSPADERWMQSVALEMNLSETAFLHPEGDAFRLRWFTPTVEVELCGHATLASAHALWESGRLGATAEARFETRSGRLTARREAGWIRMDFPAEPVEAAEPPAGLAGALGVQPAWFGRNRMDLLVEVETEAAVREVRPDYRQIAALAGVRGVIVTSRASASDYDFVSRFFCPGVGIDEDPVTGSAHCALAPYWAERFGRAKLIGYQASSRGGVVRVESAGDRVVLSGRAVTVFRGQWTHPPEPIA